MRITRSVYYRPLSSQIKWWAVGDKCNSWDHQKRDCLPVVYIFYMCGQECFCSHNIPATYVHVANLLPGDSFTTVKMSWRTLKNILFVFLSSNKRLHFYSTFPLSEGAFRCCEQFEIIFMECDIPFVYECCWYRHKKISSANTCTFCSYGVIR